MRKYKHVSEVKAKLEQEIKALEKELDELDEFHYDLLSDEIEIQIDQKREMLADKDFLIGQIKSR